LNELSEDLESLVTIIGEEGLTKTPAGEEELRKAMDGEFEEEEAD